MNGVAKPHVGIFSLSPRYSGTSYAVRMLVANCMSDASLWLQYCAESNQIVVPRRGQPREVVGKPVAFDENHVVRVHQTNAVRALHVQRPKRVAAGKVPVGFVEQVVPATQGSSTYALRCASKGKPFCAGFGCFPTGMASTGRSLKWPRRSPVHQAPRASPKSRTSALFAPLDQAVRQFKTKVKPRVLVRHRFSSMGKVKRL